MQIDYQRSFKGQWSGNKMQMANQRNINVMQMDYQWNANWLPIKLKMNTNGILIANRVILLITNWLSIECQLSVTQLQFEWQFTANEMPMD